MDAHVALEFAVRHSRVHGVEQRMDRLVRARAEQRRAENAPGRLVDVDLEEAIGFALLYGARDPRHRPLADQRLDASIFYFFL